ncbi:thiamine pyrophosphate-binding protein [uncultured Acetatifactor sp.]|uniref:thiamine pyrophosphate-binding protein n=1 Tax=uncultured Acetatifactor sp. TaxID=1671927 RepID=UPI0026177B87|nr:thiamine pyrophosphate-binding protein [uncultured Acetatifactor sp.]
MDTFYTTERNVAMLIYLMKQHGIKKVIASPGTTNITFVASIQQDSYFEIYSAADERSAAYMACGLAAESGEAVALSCTGATASRNYVPGLTEAFYRKLPVLAVTSTQHMGRIGQLCPQVIDRSAIQNDIAVMSVQAPAIYNDEDEWACNVKLNTAILALRHRGGGPVHIDLATAYSRDFSMKRLPDFRVIRRITGNDGCPPISAGRVGIFVGAHTEWDERLTHMVDAFCEAYNGVVFCDHTSNYHGKYRIQYNLICCQPQYRGRASEMELLIDMGEMSGAYMRFAPATVWRVNPDGQIRDTFHKLSYMFDMEEADFFERYVQQAGGAVRDATYYGECRELFDSIAGRVPEVPFSNVWMAQQTIGRIPEGSMLHLGILNTLRSWNFFEAPDSVNCYSNTGGFGIDGLVSAVVGAALADKDRLHFLVVGDLAFFYDMNVIANRHVGRNVRILLVNNGCGTEFKNYSHFAACFGDRADDFIAASGHYGKQSRELVRNYVENLGYTYLSANTKDEYLKNVECFTDSQLSERPILFEAFTQPEDESSALEMMDHILASAPTVGGKAKQIAKDMLGEKGVNVLKGLVRR